MEATAWWPRKPSSGIFNDSGRWWPSGDYICYVAGQIIHTDSIQPQVCELLISDFNRWIKVTSLRWIQRRSPITFKRSFSTRKYWFSWIFMSIVSCDSIPTMSRAPPPSSDLPTNRSRRSLWRYPLLSDDEWVVLDDAPLCTIHSINSQQICSISISSQATKPLILSVPIRYIVFDGEVCCVIRGSFRSLDRANLHHESNQRQHSVLRFQQVFVLALLGFLPH